MFYKGKSAGVLSLNCILLVLLLSACTTGFDLQKRRYRPGHYFSKAKTVRAKEHGQLLVMQHKPELSGAPIRSEQQAAFPKAIAPDVVTASAHEPAPERNPHRVNTPLVYSKKLTQVVYNKNAGSEKQVRRHVFVKTRENGKSGLVALISIVAAVFLLLHTLLVFFIISGNGAGIVVIGCLFFIYLVILIALFLGFCINRKNRS